MSAMRKLFIEFKSVFTGDDVLKENESHANVVVATTMMNLFLVILISWLLNRLGIIAADAMNQAGFVLFSAIVIGVPATLCFIFRGEQKWFKYVLLIAFILTLAGVDKEMTYITALLMVVPVVLSARYYSKNFTIVIATFTMVIFVLSAWARGINYLVKPQELVTVILLYYVIVFASVQVARSGRNMIERQEEISREGARIETELGLANNIQKNMLPSIFPPFPEHEEIELYAQMIPAKEVGGDFYDMFLIDDNHLAVVMADVSGKGVPASLFMMIAKTLIKNVSSVELAVDEVFTKVNNMLCDGNRAGLFVTAWCGVLDLRCGQMEFVNAGHNPPLIYSGQTGQFEYLRTKPNMVLAGMENVQYKKQEARIQPGDKLFLYTDGVVEATDEDKQLYGEQRLQEFLNSHLDLSVEDTVKEVKRDIDRFVGGAEQFDDITMLTLHYKKMKKENQKKVQKEFQAEKTELPNVQAFVEAELEKQKCDRKTVMQMNLVVEEIFVNIASYAYPEKAGTCAITIAFGGSDTLEITFEDSGMPFNPLERPDPDTTLPAEERRVGGLGILITKKTVDQIVYKYENNKNILKIIKKMKGGDGYEN